MRTLPFIAACIVCLFLSACSSGPKPLKVTGKLTYQGKPLAVDAKGGVTLTFIPVVEAGQAFTNQQAEVNREDMSFAVKGPTGQGIPAGKYRIAVMLMTPEQTPMVREINQRFTQEQSPIVRDIASEEPIVLDLSKPDGK